MLDGAHVVSGREIQTLKPPVWRFPSLSYGLLLNYVCLLFIVSMSYLAYSVTVNAEKALGQATDSIVSNTSSGLMQGLGSKLASLFLRYVFMSSNEEPFLSSGAEEIVPGIMLLW